MPASSTALNTAALTLSGVLLLVAQWQLKRGLASAKWLAAVAWLLGAAFVGLQGREWADLLAQGLTLTSSRLGAFFYLIVGAHALHAVAALIALGGAVGQIFSGKLQSGLFFGAQTFWYWVVVMWPVIYVRVYF